MIKYAESLDPKDCCGCEACIQICGHKALTRNLDAEGFIYPIFNREACVNCHLCEKVCPIENTEKLLNSVGKAFAVQNKKERELLDSSSGGVFIAIAKMIISLDGVVYGASFDKDMLLRHVRVDKIENLRSLQGSKYVQSDIGNVYKEIRKDLRDGKRVYFSGTPCQVAGLKLFLFKPFDNLFTTDLVCHGIPSQKVFHTTIKHMENEKNAKITDYCFRDKRIKGWAIACSAFFSKQNKQFKIKYSKDMEAYFNAFICGDLMRMSCYQCPFAKHERAGDITLADFWGARKYTPDFHKIHKGVSLLIANSEKGRRMLNILSDKFYYEPLDMGIATAKNHNMNAPTPITKDRSYSYTLAFNNYPAFIKKYYKQNYFISKIKVEAEAFIRSHYALFLIVSKLKNLRQG